MVSITLSWWLLPLAISVGFFAWAFCCENDNRGYGIAGGIELLFRMLVALPVSLAAWLIWALTT